MGLRPADDRSGCPAFDLTQQAAGALGVDEAGLPPVGGQDPAVRALILDPLGLAAAGLIDTQHRHRRQRGGQRLGDVVDEASCTVAHPTPWETATSSTSRRCGHRTPQLGPQALNEALAAATACDDARRIAARIETVGTAAARELPSLQPLPASAFDAAQTLSCRVDAKARGRGRDGAVMPHC